MEQQQNRRLAYNPRVVMRLRKQIAHREFQRRNLMSPKNEPMQPSLRQAQVHHEWIAKCMKCRSDEEHDISSSLFANDDLFCVRPIDALKMKSEGSDFMTLLKIEYRRYQLSNTMKSLVVHPVCLEMLRAFRNPLKVPVVFVVKESECEVNRVVLEFILMLIGIRFETIPITDEKLNENSIKANHTSILVLDNGLRKNLMETLDLNNEIVFIPVTINFDKIDGRIFHDNLGLVEINFIEPYAKFDMMKDMLMYKPKGLERISAIIDHLEYDMLKKMPIMCTNILAFLLLTRFRETGGTLESICQAFDEIQHRHRLNIEFVTIGSTREVVAYAMKMLDEFIIIQDDNVKPSDDDEKIEKLSKYSKPLARHFALQSILMISATYLDKKNRPVTNGSQYTIEKKQLVDMAELFAEKFNDEFHIMRPCADPRTEIEKVLESMFYSDIFKTLVSDEYEEHDYYELRARRFAAHLELDESDSDEDENEYDVFRKNPNTFNVRINRELMNEEIDALRNVVAGMEAQLFKRSPMESILMISAASNVDYSDDFDRDEDSPTMKKQIINDAANLIEILNHEFDLQIDPREINNEAEKVFDKCLELGYIVAEDDHGDPAHFKINESKTGEIEDLKNQILPVLDAYYTVACLFISLAEDGRKEMNYNEFIVVAMGMLSEDLEDGKAKFPQSLSKVLMKNALKYFERQISITKSKDNIELIDGLDEFTSKAENMRNFLP